MPLRTLRCALLLAGIFVAATAAAEERPPPPPPSPEGTKLKPGAEGPGETAGGIKKKKEKIKKAAADDHGPGGGHGGGGGGGCLLAPSCILGGGDSFGGGGGPFGGDEPPPRRPGPKRRPTRTKRYYFDGVAGGVWTVGSSSAAGAGGESQGADALLDVQARFEVKEGIGFDAESFTLFAGDGTLPTYAFHLSFGHVTKKLRARVAGGVRVLDLGDADVAQIWGFETGPSIDYLLTRRWKWDATALYGQFPGSVVTGMLATGFSYGEHVAPRIGYRVFLWDGVDHGPELGISLRF